jgi:AGZA family xanthine/uracil permease-like MFS transporter
VIGVGAALGVIPLLVALLPEAAVAPILIFIGLEITAQAFIASPPRHAAAVAVAFIPAVAALVLIEGGTLLAGAGKAPADLEGSGRLAWDTLLVLGNGFIVTALLWGAAVVAMVERRLSLAAAVLGLGSLAALVGIIHSPLPGGALYWPWSVGTAAPLRIAGAYGLAGAILLLLATRVGSPRSSRDSSRT